MSSAMTTRSTRRSLINKKECKNALHYLHSFEEFAYGEILPGAVPVGNCYAQKQGNMHNIII